MKIGALTDIHGADISTVAKDFKMEQVPLILFLGDFLGYGYPLDPKKLKKMKPEEQRQVIAEARYKMAKEVLAPLTSLNAQILTIRGNMDSGYSGIMQRLIEEYHNLVDMETRDGFESNGITFFKYVSDQMPRSFGIKKDKLSKEAVNAILAEERQKLLNSLMTCKGPKILMSHHPPHGYGDVFQKTDYYFERTTGRRIDDAEAKRLGMKLYNKKKYGEVLKNANAGDEYLAGLIEEALPTAVVFGHMHENNEFSSAALEIGTKKPIKPGEVVKSLTLNTGPAMKNCYALLHPEENGSIWYELSKY